MSNANIVNAYKMHQAGKSFEEISLITGMDKADVEAAVDFINSDVFGMQELVNKNETKKKKGKLAA